jgi:hypothetical protein
MDIGLVFLVVLGLAAAAFQLRTTLRVWKSTAYTKDQKIAQTQHIWLLPVIGAFRASTVLEQEDERAKPPSHQRDR